MSFSFNLMALDLTKRLASLFELVSFKKSLESKLRSPMPFSNLFF